MPSVIITDQTGRAHELDAIIGASVMEVARRAGISGIIATCGGACVCATCHVHVSPDWLAAAGPPSEPEAEMLKFAVGVDNTSRLSCQIRMTKALDGLHVRVPQNQE